VSWMETLSKWVEHGAWFIDYIKPDDASELHFYVSPAQHVVEGLLMVIFYIALVQSSSRLARKPEKFRHTSNPPLTIVEKLFAGTLIINLLAQVVYKTIRGWRVLSYLLQPCHTTTFLFIYCLLSTNYPRASRVFQIALHYSFFTILAIAVPDLGQLRLPFEILNFWIQHYILLLTPLYLLFFSTRFPLEPSVSTTLLALGLLGLFHYVLQLPVAMMTGVNVNYMLWPPPGVPTVYTGPYYRQAFTITFIILGTTMGYILPKLALLIQRPTASKKQQ